MSLIDGTQISLSGYVLHLRGDELVRQPAQYKNGDILLWNAEIFGGIKVTYTFIVKPDVSGHSKIDKTKVLKPCGSLMQVKSTAAFCNTYAIISLENLFLSSLSGRFKRQVLLYLKNV